MKKNILLVHSLLILPLMSSSLILSSEKSTKGTQLGYTLKDSGSHKKSKKTSKPNKRAPTKLNASQEQVVIQNVALIQEDATQPIVASDEITAIEKAPTNAVIVEAAPAVEVIPLVETLEITTAIAEENLLVEGPAPKPSVIPTEDTVKARLSSVLSSLLTAQKDAAIRTAVETTIVPVALDLSASVYQPTPAVKQGLGWREWAISSVSSTWFALDAIQAKTFDPENTDHMKGLNAAAEKLVLTGDSKGLKDLLEACRANYPNIELKHKVALQIQKRFDMDKVIATEEYKKSIALENEKLIVAREAILNQSAELVVALTKKLEVKAEELAKAEVHFGLATNNIIEAQNKKLQDARKGTKVVSKLRRDLSTESTFDSEYLKILKTTEATHEEMGKLFNDFKDSNNLIQSVIPLIKSEKTIVVAIDKK